MAFVVTGVANYTKENVDLLIKNSLFEARTQQLILSQGNVLTGVKSAEAVGSMDTDVFFQDDSSCGFSASGTTEFTQRTLTVGKVKINENLCQKDLETKYLQNGLKAGGTYDDLAFAADYTEQKAGRIAEALEVAIWQATGAGYGGTNGLLNKFKGIRQLVADASGTVIDANASDFISGGPITGIDTPTKAINSVKAVIKAMPAKIKGKSDVVIFVGWDVFDLLVEGYIDLNLFHYNPGADKQNPAAEFTIPGSSYKVIPVHGLDDLDSIYAFRMSNIFMGTDLLGEENDFKIWYSQDDDVMKFMTRFKIGVQFGFMDEVVAFEA